MAVLTWPNEALERTATPVPQGERCRDIVDQMFAAMQYPHGIGIAAPQLGIDKRIICINVPAIKNGKVVGSATKLHLLNPELVWFKGGPFLDYEGCLSFPGEKVAVPRFDRIRVRGFDLRWSPVSYVLRGLAARVVQHEIDHLNGRTLDFYEKLAAAAMAEASQ